jgi:hypothetical protein
MSFTSKEQVDDCQDDDRPNEGYQQAGQVETGHTSAAQQAENPAADCRANNAGNVIGDASHLIVALHHDAGQSTGQAAQNNPTQNIHGLFLHFLLMVSFFSCSIFLFNPSIKLHTQKSDRYREQLPVPVRLCVY